ncbi:MAG: TonB-dependent receptor [Bacteroidales bacterium]
MKKLFCALAFSHVLALSAQDNANLSLKVENKPISVVLNEITKKAGYSFVIPTNGLDVNQLVSIDVTNQPVSQVLARLFGNTTVSYRIEGKSIYITRQTQPLGKNKKAIDIKGTVLDEKGEPIIGATVVDPISNTGTVTDFNGKFSVLLPEGTELTVSYMGYESKKIKTGSKKELVVRLIEDSKKLDEVVVVGYGVQKKSDLTGAIVSIKSEDLNETPTSSMAEMLRGKAPGVQVNLGNAKPGGSSSILIRGRRSLSAGNNPLYIVDGVPMEQIDEINSNDIASLEILKDASSQSIYGARAANGVVLVTTKRGISGKPKVDYNFYIGRQDINRNFDFYNGPEWAEYRKEAFTNANGYYDEEQCFSSLMLDVLNSGNWVDWEDVMINPALQQKHDLTVRSGNDKSKMAFSLGYFDQNGIVRNSDYRRITGRLNIDHKILNNLSLGANLYYSNSRTNSADGSFNTFITMPPLAKIYNDDGSLRMDVTEVGDAHYNPLWNIDRAINEQKNDNFLTNLYIDWEIIKGLTYRANGSMNYRNEQLGSYLYRDHTVGRNTKGKALLNNTKITDYLFENILNYNKDFNTDNRLSATLMQSVNVINRRISENVGMGFANDEKGYDAISSAMEFGTPTWGITERKLLSYMGRVNYTLLNRYTVSAALRIDGSSVFGKNNKYGYFPSAAASWRVNEEKFMRNLLWISNLKIRGSWGQVGNQGVSPYSTLGLTDRYVNEFGDDKMVGFLPGSELWNPNLKWETSTTTNFGLDFGFLKERISGVLEFYKTNTSDLLVKRSISQALGYTSQMVNLGKVENKGVEFALNGYPIRTSKVSWNLNYSISANRNKIVKITGETDENGKPLDDINSGWFIGKSMNVHYNYKFDGIWQLNDDIINSHMPTAQPGMVKVADVTGDGVISSDDRIIMNRDPKWISSFGTTLNLYGVDLSCDFYVSYGGILYNSYLTDFAKGGDMLGKLNGIKRDYWTQINPSNTAPAPNYVQQPAYMTALGYQDATYIRLRNLTVGYTLPREITKKFYIQNLRVYFTANNLWTKTDVLSYSPEVNTGGYPEPRTFLFGLNISL